MPLSALALVLTAALLHALWNLAAKRNGASGGVFVLACSALSAVLWAPLALGWHAQALVGLPAEAWMAVWASAVIHVFYFLALLRAYELADLSVVYPVARGTGPLLAALAAMALLGETLSAMALTGLLMIVAGTFTIAGGANMLRGPISAATLRGLGWGMLTGVLIAAYTINDGRAVRMLGVPPLLFDWLGITCRVVLLAPLAWLRGAGLGAALRADWRPILTVALLSPAAYILVLYAMTLAPVSLVAPARELSLLIATLFGARLLGEPDMWRRLSGALLIACGVLALSLSG